MKVMLVCMGAENLGVASLAAWLQRGGHETKILFDPALFDDKRFLHMPRLRAALPFTELLAAEAKRWRPGLLGFSVMSCMMHWAVPLAARLKRDCDCPVVFGGVHPTMVPERVLRHDAVDYVIAGEGEETLTELADCLQAGRDPRTLRNLWYRLPDGTLHGNPLRPLLRDLDTLPFPDREVFAAQTDARFIYRITVSRGCPYRCTFCSHNYLRTLYPGEEYVRFRSPEHVLAELRTARQRWPTLHTVKFMDDCFTLRRDWLTAFLPAYQRTIGLPFECIVHPAQLDHDVAAQLKAAGCALVELGIQAVNADVRRRILGRTESDAQVQTALAACEATRLPCTPDYMFGVPEESVADHRRAAELFAAGTACPRITTYWLSYFPKTEIIDRALAAGTLATEAVSRIEEGEAVTYLQAGALTATRLRAANEHYRKFLQVLPLLPCPLRGWLLTGDRIALLRHVPEPLVTLLMLLTAVVRGERIQYYYARHYLQHLCRWLRWRLTGNAG